MDKKNFSMDYFTTHIEARKRDVASTVAKVGIYKRMDKPAYVRHESSPLAEVL